MIASSWGACCRTEARDNCGSTEAATMTVTTHHRNALRPEDWKTKVWRYLDFAKFMSLLNTRSIMFPRADTLGDPFEAAWSPEIVNEGINFAKKMKSDDEGFIEQRKEMSARIAQDGRERLVQYAVSCWRLSEHESDAMWRAYITGSGVAVQTTYQKLYDTLHANQEFTFHMGKVDYDPSRMLKNVTQPPFFKRPLFATDEEFRAVIFQHGKPIDEFEGIKIRVDLEALVETVWITPSAKPWVRETVDGVLEQYKLKIPTRHSSIFTDPYTGELTS
jgi:hypothetical protein